MECKCPLNQSFSKQMCWPPSPRRSGFPPGPSPKPLEAQSAAAPRILVVLDDDPTGTQSVADLPVLTRWEVADFTWAFNHRINGRRQDAVYVLTNTRSLDPAEAAARNEEVVRNALAAAALEIDGAIQAVLSPACGLGSSAAATPPSAATTRWNRTPSRPPSPLPPAR